MKKLRFSSFRQRLNAAFLAVSLAPLLLCAGLLLQIFRFRMTADQQQNAQQQLTAACHALDTVQDGILAAAEELQEDATVLRALSGSTEDSAKVYESLYDAAGPVRNAARFDLYGADGTDGTKNAGFRAPGFEWEKRTAALPPDAGGVRQFRLGFLPYGHQLKLWLRNFKVLKDK